MPPSTSEPRNAPVFILGMLPRSGTNLLADLFEVHPDVHVMKPIFEDGLIRRADKLKRYVNDVTVKWSPNWEVPEHEPADLLRALGDGILGWLNDHAQPHETVVTKMPNLENAELFFELFPSASLVLLVRDGRSVTESAYRSFAPQSYEHWFRRWNAAGTKALDLLERFDGQPRFELVRYEDLVNDRSSTIKRLLSVVGLDPDKYSTDGLETLPVRGSSEVRSESGVMHWEPREASDSFAPLERWREWDGHTHRRFAAVAGEVQTALGYDLVDVVDSGGPSAKVRSGVDLAWASLREERLLLKRAVHEAREAVRRI